MEGETREKFGNEEILVSVSCLAYNHEKYIRNALEGFVHQKTNFKYEVLIHDDASTDGTQDIIREYEEKYPELIKPIYQKENQMSQGIKIGNTYQYPRAKGKYVCWCEGDDYWCDEYKLQKQFDVMQENPECTICVHKVACINEDGAPNDRVIPEDFYNISGGLVTHEKMCHAFWLDGGYPFHTSSYFVRKEILTYKEQNHHFFDSFNGDMSTLKASFCLGDFYYIDEVMSIRRLFSIGGYNFRMKLWNEKQNIDFIKNAIYGELKFNELTEGKYENYIKTYCANLVLDLRMSDLHEARKLLKDAGVKWDNVKGMKLWKKISYILLSRCMILYKLTVSMRKLKAKIKNARQ